MGIAAAIPTSRRIKMPRYYVTPKHNIPNESRENQFSAGLHRFSIDECYSKYAALCMHETVELQGSSSTPRRAEVNGKPHSTAANTRRSEHAGKITTRHEVRPLSCLLAFSSRDTNTCLNPWGCSCLRYSCDSMKAEDVTTASATESGR